jgi:ribonuclease HI
MKIVAAADGSALGNPGPAGWGWYIDDDRWASGGWPHGTNNQGELMAVLDLLKQTRGVDELEILCDSQYVINSVTKWMPGWKRKGWRKADGKPVLNVELLKELDREMAGRNITFTWIKGHAGHPLNEAADLRANGAAQRFARGDGGNAGPGFSGAQTGTPRPAAPAPAATEQESREFDHDTPALWEDGAEPWADAVTEHERITALEKSLLDPAVRADAAEVAYLLHPDFQEIGASGRTLTKEDALAMLAGEDRFEAPVVDVLTTRDLTPDLIQIIYRTVPTGRSGDRAVLRTSLWQRAGGRWQMVWHQGTPEEA